MADDNYQCASGQRIIAGRHGLPAWRTSMAPLTWASVGSNTLSDVDPEKDPLVNPNGTGGAPWHGNSGHASVVSAYNGGAWDEDNKCLYIIGGGHQDYAGNELYRWDATTGTFARLTNPTGSIGNTGVLNDGNEISAVYFDGQPRSWHTYGNLAVRAGVLWMTGGSVYITGGATGRPFRFDANANAFVMDSSVTTGSYGSICYDSTRDRILTIGSANTGSFYDPISHTNVGTSKGVSGGIYNRTFYVASRDVIVYFNGASAIQVMDPAGIANTIPVTQAGTGPVVSSFGVMPVAYDPDNERFIAWVGGTNLYQLAIPATLTDPWVWSPLAASGANAVTPTAPVSVGTWGRFWYSSALKCVGVVNATTQKMYVFSTE